MLNILPNSQSLPMRNSHALNILQNVQGEGGTPV